MFQQDSYVSVDYQAREGKVYRRVAKAGEVAGVEVDRLRGDEGEPLKLELESFLYAVRTGTLARVSGEEGAAALELAHQVLDAIGTFVRRHAASPER